MDLGEGLEAIEGGRDFVIANAHRGEFVSAIVASDGGQRSGGAFIRQGDICTDEDSAGRIPDGAKNGAGIHLREQWGYTQQQNAYGKRQ
jgi:hypothetical protein